MSDQIKVAIKVRPLIEREQFENQAWSVLDNTIFQIDPSTGKRRGDIYKFDHIFDTFSRNQDVFDTVVKPLVDAAVGGFNATVFAYGQTSSGKTYTMSGDETECGVIQMAISHMFEAMKQTSGREFLARASHLEIYNEKVRDLLGSDKTNLQIREVEGNVVVVSNLKEEIVGDVSKTIYLMKKGERKRHVGETAMNEKSSRSHSIFRIIIESRDTEEGDAGAVQVSQLNFVDLAGSERVNQTGAQGERLKEGCSINRSLFMLGHVISQLSEGQRTHINFRDSKLTRILQPSLGGNALTVIICTVTPAAIEETHCTLGFASRAKNIKNEPHLNEVLSDGTLLKRYARQLSKLKAELQEAKASNFAQEVEAMENKLEEKDKHNRLLQARIDLLTEKLISGATTKDRNQAFKRRRTWCAPSARLSFLPLSLATIDEVTSPCKKPVNILESSLAAQFQIPLEEFELQLLSAEVDSVSSEPPIIADVMQSPISESVDSSIDTVLSCPHVTSRSRRRRSSELHIDEVKSPVGGMCHAGCQTDPVALSPEHTYDSRSANGTPRNELRERISFWKSEHDLMTMEYDELREYTRLESDCIRDLHEKLEKSRQEVIKTREENDQLKMKLSDEKVKAEMRIHELEELNRQSNRKWETLDMEFLSDVPTTPDGKELRQIQEENIQCNEIIAEKETANQLLEEQLTHMSIVLAEINDTKNQIVSQKDKEILALQEEMSLLRTDQEAHKQEVFRLHELVAQSSVIIEEKNKMILHLEDKLSHSLSDPGAEEIVNNELERLNSSLLEKNQEILALQDQILLLNTNFSNEKIMLQDEIAEREQRICNLEEQLTSLPSNTATKKIVDDLKMKIADLESMVFEKNKLIVDLEEQVSLLNTKATGEKCEISKLQEVFQCSLAEKEQKIIELEEKLLHSSSTLATGAETVNKLEDEISNLKNIIAEKSEKLTCLQEKISLLNISVGDEKLQVSTLSEEIAHLSLMIKEKDQRIIDLEERLLHASSVTTAAETLTEMENEIANLKNVISDNNREILTLQDQVSQGILAERLTEEISVLQGEIAKHCITIREKDQKIFDLEDQVLCMSSVSSSTATELENEVIGLKEVISEKNKELLTYQDQLSLLSVNARDCKHELDRLLGEKAEQSVVIADKEQKIRSLERQLLQVSSFMTTDTKTALENEVTNAILESKDVVLTSACNCDGQRGDADSLQDDLDQQYLGEQLLPIGTGESVIELQNEISQLKNVISQKNDEIFVLSDQVSSVMIDENQEQMVNRLQEEIAHHSTIIKEKDQRIIDLEQQILQMSSVIAVAKTRSEMVNPSNFFSEKNGEVLPIQDQSSFLHTYAEDQTKEVVRLQEEIAHHSVVINDKEQKMIELEQLPQTSSISFYTEAMNELQNKIVYLENIISKKNEENLILQEKISNTGEKHQANGLVEELCLSSVSSTAETVTLLEKEITALRNVISEKNCEIVALQDQISLNTDGEKQEVSTLQEEIAQQRLIIQEKDSRIHDLEDQLLTMSSVTLSAETAAKLKNKVANLMDVISEKEGILTFQDQIGHEGDAQHSTTIKEKEQSIYDREQLSCLSSPVTTMKSVNELENKITRLRNIISDKECEILALQRYKSLVNTAENQEEKAIVLHQEKDQNIVLKEKEQRNVKLEPLLCRASSDSPCNEIVTELEKEVAHLKNMVSEKNREILFFQDQISSLRNSAEYQKLELNRFKEEIALHSMIIKNKDQRIIDLEKQVSHMSILSTVPKLETEMVNGGTNGDISALEDHVSLSTNAEDQIQEIEISQKETSRLSAIICEKDQRIIELEKQPLQISSGMPSYVVHNETFNEHQTEIATLNYVILQKDKEILSLKEKISRNADITCEMQGSNMSEEKPLFRVHKADQTSEDAEEQLSRLSLNAAFNNHESEPEISFVRTLLSEGDMSLNTCESEEISMLKEKFSQKPVHKDREESILDLESELKNAPTSTTDNHYIHNLESEISNMKAVIIKKNEAIIVLQEQMCALNTNAVSDQKDLCRLKQEVMQWSALSEEKDHIILDLKKELTASCRKEDFCRLKEEVAQLSAVDEEKDRIILDLKEQLSISCGRDELYRLREEITQLSALAEEKEHIIVGLKEQLSVSCGIEDLCRLKEEVAQLSALTVEKENIILDLKERLSVSCSKEELCRLKEEVAQWRALAEEKERIIVDLKEQLSVSCGMEDLCRLKEEVAQLSALTVEKENIILDLKEQLSVSCGMEDLCRLKEEVAQLSALTVEKENIILDLKEQLSVSCSKEELCRLKEEVAQWCALAEEKEHIVVDLKQQLSVSCGIEDLCRLKEEVAQLSSLTVEKENIILDLKERLSVSCSKGELCRLKEEVAQWRALAEEKERIIVDLKEQLSVSCGMEDLCRLKEEVAQLSALTVEKDNIILDLKEQLSVSCGKEELSTLKEEVTQWSSFAEEKKHIVEGLKEQLSVSCGMEDLCNLKEEVARLSFCAEEKEQIIVGLKEQLSLLCGMDDLGRLKEEVARWSSIAEEKECIIVGLKEQLSVSCDKEDVCKLKEEVARLSALTVEKDSIILDLKEQLSVSCSKEELSRLKEEVAQWCALAEEKEHIIVDLKEQLSVTCSMEDLCRLKEEVAQLSALTVEKDSIILDLKEQLSVSCKEELCRLKEEVAQLSALAEEKEHIEGLKEQLSVSSGKEDLCKLKEEVAQLSAVTLEKDSIIIDLKEQLSLSCGMEDLCKLKEEVAQLSALTVEKDNIILDLKEHLYVSCGKEDLCNLKEEVSHWSSIAEGKEHIVEGLKEQLSVSFGKEELFRLKEEVAQLSALAEEKEHIIVDLKEQLSVSCGMEDLCKLKEEVAQLSAVTVEKDSIILDLKEQLSVSCDKEELCRLKEDITRWCSLAEEKEHIIVGLREQLSVSSGEEELCRLREEISQWCALAEEKEHIIVGLKEQLSVSCGKEDLCRLKEEVSHWSSIAEEKECIIVKLKEQLSLSCDKEDLCKLKEEVAQLSALTVEKDRIILDLKEQLSVSCGKEELCRLKEEVTQWCALAEEKEHIIADLKQQLSVSRGKEDLCKLKEEVARLSALTVEKDNIILDLKEQLSVSYGKEEICRLREEISQWCALAEEKECIIIRLKEQLSVSCESDKELEARLVNLDKAISQKDTEIMSLQEINLSVSTDITCKMQEIDRLQEEIKQWCTNVREKNETIKGLEEQLSLLLVSSETVSKLEVEIDSLKNILSERNNKVQAFEEHIRSLTVDMTSRNEEICRLEKELAQMSTVVRGKEQKIFDLELELKNSSTTDSKLVHDLEHEISNLKTIISEKGEEIIALQEQISVLLTNSTSEKQELSRLREEVAQSSAIAEEKERVIIGLKEQLSVSHETVKELETGIANLISAVSHKDTEILALKEKISLLDTNLSNEKHKANRLLEEIAQWSATVLEKEKSMQNLEEKLSEMSFLEAEIVNLKNIVSNKQNENIALKEQIAMLNTNALAEKQELGRLKEEVAQPSALGKEKEQTIHVLKEQVSFHSTLINNDCVNNNEVEIHNLKTILSDKNNEIAVLNELVTSLKTDLASRMQEINKLEEEITKKFAVTKEKEQKILELEEQVKSILGEITSRHDTEAEIVNRVSVVPEKNEVHVLEEHISIEAAAADSQKHERLKEENCSPLEEKQLTSKSSLSVQVNLDLSQGQTDENNRAIHLLEEELSNLSKKLGEESETVKNLQHENKTMKNKLIEMVEHRKHLVSEILALDSKFERDSLEDFQLSELLKTFCSCIIQKEEEVLGFQIQQRELLVEEKNRLTSRLECLESELLEKEEEYKNLLCAFDDVKVAKDNLTAEVQKKMSHLNSIKDELMGARKEIEQLNCKLSSHKTFEVIFDKLIKNLSAVPELNVHSGHDVLPAVNMLIDRIQNPQTVKDLKWKDCLKEVFEGDNEVKKCFENDLKNKQNMESEEDDFGYAVECKDSSYSFPGNSLAKCHLTNSVQKMNADSAQVFQIASEIDGESNLAVVIRSFMQRLIAAKEYDNKYSILTEQLDCMKQQNELLKKHLDSLLGMEETKKELKATEKVITEIPELVSNAEENNSHSLLLNMNITKQGNKPALKFHELHGEEHANNTEWKKDGTERIAMRMTLLNKLEDDMNKIRELLASVTELDGPIDIVSSVDMLIKNLQRSWEITEEMSGLRAENDSLRKEITILKSDIREIELMFSIQDEVNSDLAVKHKFFMNDGQHLKDVLNAKVQIVKEMEKLDREISELLSSVPELNLGNGTMNAVKVLVDNFISSKNFTERMNKLKEERSFFKQKSIALQERLECLNLDLQGKREECNYLQNDLSCLQAKVKTLEGEISHYSEYVEKLEIDARKIFELSALEPGLDHQNNAVTAFTVVLEKLHTAQKLNEDKFKLEIEFAQVRKENEDMKKEIFELKHDIQEKKEELFKTQREIENKQITENKVHCIEILKQELEALKRDLHDFENDSSDDCETLLMSDLNPAEDLVLAVKFLFQKFKALKNCTIENIKLNKTLNELKQENSVMKENLESLTLEIEKVRKNKNDLMEALNNVQASKEMLLLEMEETVNSKQFEIKALKESLNCKSAILHTMEDDNAKINTLLSSYPELYCNTDTISSISAMIKRLQFCRENHEIKLKDENVFLRQENEAMQKQIVSLNSDIESQKQTCKHLSETVRKLQTNINEMSSKELKESSNWKSFKEEIITKAQCLEMTMEPDLIEIYEQIMNIPETDFPRNLIPLVTLLTDKLAKQDLKNRVLNNKLYFQETKHEEALKEIHNYETEIYQMEEKIENLSLAVEQEKERAENLRSEKVRLQEEWDAEVAALTAAKKQLDEISMASEKLQTAEKWLAERDEVIANLRLAEKQFSDLGYKRQGDIITRVGSKCSPYQIGSSAKSRIKNLEEQVTELRRQLLEHQGASGRSVVSVGVNTKKDNECDSCLASQTEIRNLKLEILGHKSKVELLKDQIAREEMKYKEDAEVFERKLGAAKSKIGEFKMEIRRLQAAQEVSFVAEARKKQPTISKCDQQIQTDKEVDVVYRMSGEGSGIVNDYVVTVYKEKVKKLLHENELLKELSRRRLHKLRLIQGQLPPEDKEEMEKSESRKENIDCNVNSGKTSDSSIHKRKKPASSSHS